MRHLIPCSTELNGKIFIQIPSYRDPELPNTIQSALDNARNPNRLIFAICWQHGSDENLDKYINDKRFKIIDVHYNDSKGVGWARNEIQKLYNGEEYTLQLDSHHRFVPDWDMLLIRMLESLRDISSKPIITTYGAQYTVGTDGKPDQFVSADPCKMEATEFRNDGSIGLAPHYIIGKRSNPIPARFSSAHFMFSSGEICTECPSDPDMYFDGEEITRTIRCYTLGYDMFHPNIHIIWHEYTRQYRKKHWDDHTGNILSKNIAWYKRDAISKRRIRKLLGIEDNDEEMGLYGLGSVRTISDYEKFANINFKTKTIGKFDY